MNRAERRRRQRGRGCDIPHLERLEEEIAEQFGGGEQGLDFIAAVHEITGGCECCNPLYCNLEGHEGRPAIACAVEERENEHEGTVTYTCGCERVFVLSFG